MFVHIYFLNPRKTIVRILKGLKRLGKRAYQPDLKKVVGARMWRLVGKRDLELINELVEKELPGHKFIKISRVKNPNTGRKGQFLYEIPPQNDFEIEDEKYIKLMIKTNPAYQETYKLVKGDIN